MTKNKRHILFISLGLCALFISAYGFVAFSSKPSLLDNIPFSSAYYDRTGKLLRLSLAEDESYRLFTKLEDINPDLIKATLIQEDQYFYYHPGVNPYALFRGAFETYIRKSRPIGGSTITMQFIRIRDQIDTRTFTGKLTQIFRALQLEAHYSKADILEAYLNVAPYGGNIYGAGTASLIYFKQPAHKLALLQSFSLAVIPQNPVKRFPLRANNEPWQKARLRLFERLSPKYDKNYLNLAKMDLTTFKRKDLPFLAPHFINDLKKDKHRGHVQTTLDLQTQTMLEHTLSSFLEHHKAQGFDNASIMLIHYPTMEIRSLIGSANFFNTSIQGQVDGTMAQRSPGSTLKPFVYALALEQGLIHPESLLDDDPTFFAEYRPGNFDKRFIGKIPAREALILSRNIPAISLAQKLQNPDLYEFLQNSGAQFPQNKKHYGLSIVVGGAETNMRRLVKFYAMLANGGILQDLKSIKKQSHTPTSSTFLSPESALITLKMLEQSRPQTLPFTTKQQNLSVYWKTGTSNGFRDAWTVGIFGPYVLAVWVGHFDGHANPSLIGAKAALPLFFDIERALENKELLKDKITPAIKKLNIADISVCSKTGEIKPCDITQNSLFIPGKSPFSTIHLKEKKPEILSPRENISYAYRYKNNEQQSIPLEAKNHNKEELYWFADNRFLGVSKENNTLFWDPESGEHMIRVVNKEGYSDSKKISVVVLE